MQASFASLEYAGKIRHTRREKILGARYRKSETTPFHPCSPYAVAKVYAYRITVNDRVAFGNCKCNGIHFDHESPRCGETFVTRTITRSLANIAHGLEQCLYLGNMDSLRDWGNSKDYVRIQWLMLQRPLPQDYVIAAGVQYSVRQFIIWAAEDLDLKLRFEGHGEHEVAYVAVISGDKAPALQVGQRTIAVAPQYFRPAEVETLLGDASEAKRELGWAAEISARDMCSEMLAEDLIVAQRHSLLRNHGHRLAVPRKPSPMRARRTSDLVIVAGHHDMVGSAIIKRLNVPGFRRLLTASHSDLDLTSQAAVRDSFAAHHIDQVVLASAKVAGIEANNLLPAEFIYENLTTQANVILAAHFSARACNACCSSGRLASTLGLCRSRCKRTVCLRASWSRQRNHLPWPKSRGSNSARTTTIRTAATTEARCRPPSMAPMTTSIPPTRTSSPHSSAAFTRPCPRMTRKLSFGAEATPAENFCTPMISPLPVCL